MWATGPRRWAEPVVQRLIGENDGRPPELVLERIADQLRAQQDQLPIDPGAIAARLSICRNAFPLPYAGRIWVAEGGETRLEVNAGDRLEQQRFTEAHLLMHTAFPGFEADRRYRLDPTSERNPANRQEEHLCDRGAAALLMPRELVRGRFDPRGGFDAVERLADAAQVTFEAAANRLVAVSDEPVVLLCMSTMHEPVDWRLIRQGDAPPNRLRVRYAAAHGAFVSIPLFASPDDGSGLAEAASTQEVRVTDRLPGVSYPLFDMNVRTYGDRTYAFAWPVTLGP
jgi:hypothetical protein